MAGPRKLVFWIRGQAELGQWAAWCLSPPCISHFCWGSSSTDTSQRIGQRPRENWILAPCLFTPSSLSTASIALLQDKLCNKRTSPWGKGTSAEVAISCLFFCPEPAGKERSPLCLLYSCDLSYQDPFGNRWSQWLAARLIQVQS